MRLAGCRDDLLGHGCTSVCMVILLLSMFTGCRHNDAPAEATPLDEFFDPNTQAYAFTIPNLEPVDGVGGVAAKDCGTCHKSIYQEWSNTTHASALRDIQFQSEITKPESPKWLCLNCHIPDQNQRQNIVTHLEGGDILRPATIPNPLFDKAMQQEGVTCASCHVRSDVDTGKSYIVGKRGSAYAPHPVKKDPVFLQNICSRCHNPVGTSLSPNLVCWFNTEEELEAGQQALINKYGSEQSCVDCHMPTTERHLADDFSHLPRRTSRQHHWIGGGIPKWYSHYDTLLERGFSPGLKVEVEEIPEITPDDTLQMVVTLTNEKAGHHLPTGDPERFILAVASLSDHSGTVVDQKKVKIGQTWEWNPARKVADNRLQQGESLQWPIAFSLPDNLNGLHLVLTVYHVRLSSTNAQYILEATNVDERLLQDGAQLVANVAEEYPFATFLYRETITLSTGERYTASPAELIALSKSEQDKDLSSRNF